MSISYRTRQALRHGTAVTATVIAIIAVALLCLFVWLQRFVVYTDNGVILDFDRKASPQAQLPKPSQPLPNVTIEYDDTPFQEGLQQLSGYHISEQALMDDPDAVRAKLEQLPAGTPVLLDVKGYRGYFYYSSRVGAHTSGLYDIDKMTALMTWLGQSDLYVIARMSSLRDFVSVWDNNSLALKTTSGNPYTDQGQYGLGYWLDPTNATVQNYLIDVVRELKTLGVDEVVLQNFRFPEVDNLAFAADREESLNRLAQKLITSCADDSFAISFSSDGPSFSLPDSRCRLYLENISAENAQQAWAQATMEEKRLYLVFIAPNGDTRYDIENGILRPLI